MATIQIRTEIPGPRSRALMARREAAIPRGPANAMPVFAARAVRGKHDRAAWQGRPFVGNLAGNLRQGGRTAVAAPKSIG